MNLDQWEKITSCCGKVLPPPDRRRRGCATATTRRWRTPPARPATDVYSLGCIFVEMLTGKVLFDGATPDEIITQHLVDGSKISDHFSPGTPEGIHTVLHAALEKNPLKRYQSSAEFFSNMQNKPIQPRVPQSLRSPSIAKILGFVGGGIALQITLIWGIKTISTRPLSTLISWILPYNQTTQYRKTPIVSEDLITSDLPATLASPVITTTNTFFTPTSTPYASNFVSCVGVCKSDLSNKKIVFPEKTTSVNFQFSYDNIPQGANVVRRWNHNNQDWVIYDCKWNLPSSGKFITLLREPYGLRSGEWEYEMLVNNSVILRASFIIEGDYDYWDPAGRITDRCKDD